MAVLMLYKLLTMTFERLLENQPRLNGLCSTVIAN